MTALRPNPIGPNLTGIRRIVFVSVRFPDVSGGTTAVVQAALALEGLGYTVDFVSLYSGPVADEFDTLTIWKDELLERQPLRAMAIGSGRSIVTFPFRAMRKLAQRRRARQRVSEWSAALGPDTAVIATHVHALRGLHHLGFDSASCEAKIVGQHHSQFKSIELEGLSQEFAEHFRALDAFVALTQEDADSFSAVVDCPTFAIPNMLAPTELRTDGLGHRAIAVGRLTGEKQFALLADAFARATRDRELNHWKLDIFGEGPEQAAIQAVIDEAGAENRIRLCGSTTEPRSEMARANVILSTSLIEGFGMTILEAASVGVPAIAFACSPGVRSLVRDGAGILVEDQTVSGMAQALRTALKDTEQLERWGKAAMEHSRRYEPAVVRADWEALFMWLTEETARGKA